MPPSWARDLGEEIERKRKEHGLSQGRLALLMDRHRATIANWEAGQSVPNVEEAMALCRHLETELHVSGFRIGPVESGHPKKLEPQPEQLELSLGREYRHPPSSVTITPGTDELLIRVSVQKSA
jgi:DNA-binding XRE family transcriptional regulator